MKSNIPIDQKLSTKTVFSFHLNHQIYQLMTESSQASNIDPGKELVYLLKNPKMKSLGSLKVRIIYEIINYTLKRSTIFA